jgi:hypothetical protein
VAERPIFYLDRCLGKTVAAAMVTAGAEVRLPDDYFAQDAPDEVWIPEVAERGWVILTKDKNIRRRHGERETALLSEAKLFTLSSGGLRGSVMAAIFVKQLETMELMALALTPPFLAVISRDNVEIIYPVTLPETPTGESEGDKPQPKPKPAKMPKKRRNK